MVTFGIILLAVLVLALIVCMVNAVLNGCPFGWLFLVFGGFGQLFEFLGECIGAIASGFNS